MTPHPRIRDVGPLPWLYYWLDLFGPNGTPANTKVLSAWGFFVAIAAEVWWGIQLTLPQCRQGPNEFVCTDPAGITWPFVTLIVATLAVAMGKDVFKVALKLRGGGYEEPMPPWPARPYGPDWRREARADNRYLDDESGS